jgi:hypothetical protein
MRLKLAVLEHSDWVAMDQDQLCPGGRAAYAIDRVAA